MITLKEWMELVDYKITEGSDWHCGEPDMYSLTYWNGDHMGYSTNIVFNTKTQNVHLVEICDYLNNRAYRRMVDKFCDDNVAYDDVKFVGLESDDDFIQKTIAIMNGEDYDTRVTIPIELSDEELLRLMIMAQERDMSFNDFVGVAIMDYAKKILGETNETTE